MTDSNALPGARVLSLRQPWLDLILAGIKTSETRKSRRPNGARTRYCGPVLLHASAKPPTAKECGAALDYALIALERRTVPLPTLDELCFMGRGDGGTHLTDAARFGRVLAVATLTGCEPYTPALVRAGIWPYADGEHRFAWHLSNVREISPGIPWKGGLGLRHAPPELIAEVERSLTP